jgi:hypothetical protein
VVFGRNAALDGPFAASFNLSTLNGTNGFILNGDTQNDNSGFSVASAGDANGDGIDDLIIGAALGDANGMTDAGESYVVFGRNTAVEGPFAASLNLSTLNGTNGFVLNGIDAFDRSGRSVASAGDVDGDGIDDLIIGANDADPNGQIYAGESYVVFGRPGQVWTSPAGGSWDAGAKWLSGKSPMLGIVVIDTPIGVTVTGPADPVFLDRLTLRADAGRTTVNLVANSYMEVEQSLTIPAVAGLGGSGILVADAGLTNEGQIRPTSLVFVTDAGMTNSGVIRLETFGPATDPIELTVFGPLHNAASGEIVARGMSVIDATTGLTNDGDVGIAFAATSVFGPINNTPSGFISISGGSTALWSDDAINSGTIELTTDSSLSILGSLTGGGVSGPGGGASGPVYVEGGLVPGPLLGPGIASFGGDVSMGSVGTTTIEIGGATPGPSGHDQVAALGSIGAAGTLEVNIIDGYIPHPGDEYAILVGATITGSFSTIILDPALISAGVDTSTLLIDGTIRIPGAPTCAGDVNNDGFTNAADFTILAGNFGATVPTNTLGDLNGDGTVNAADFVILAGNFGCDG